MIKISHINGDEKYVTKGAFESIFEPLGYKIADKEIKEFRNELTGNKEESNIKSFEESKAETKVFDEKNENKDKRK